MGLWSLLLCSWPLTIWRHLGEARGMNDSRQLSSGPSLVYLLWHIIPVTFLSCGFPKHTYSSCTFLLHPFPDSLDNPHRPISRQPPCYTSPANSTLKVDMYLLCWCSTVCQYYLVICFHRLWGRAVKIGWTMRTDKQISEEVWNGGSLHRSLQTAKLQLSLVHTPL